jgi:hypothetical protein
VLHLVDCNHTSLDASADDFQFSLVDEIDKKRIELHALGKSGFNVAIGPIQTEDALARTVTIKIDNSYLQDISLSEVKPQALEIVPTPIKMKKELDEQEGLRNNNAEVSELQG